MNENEVVYVILYTYNEYDGEIDQLETTQEHDEEGVETDRFGVAYRKFEDAMKNKPKSTKHHLFQVVPVRIK